MIWTLDPSPSPVISPGTTTPVADLLFWAHLEAVVTIGALITSLAGWVGVFRTLVVATRTRRAQVKQAEEWSAKLDLLLARLPRQDQDQQGRKPPPPAA